MPPVKSHTPELADRLVDVAAAMVAADGPAALSLRKLAGATATSTMAVYTLFGDKQGLLSAMHATGFSRLGQALEAAADAESGEPLDVLAALGVAYRVSALASPHLYGLMFGPPVPGVLVDHALADAAFQPLVSAVATCQSAGVLVGSEAEPVAEHLWAVAHGMVSLELAGHLRSADAEQAYERALVNAAVPFLGPG